MAGAARIGSLHVMLGLDSAQFTAGLAKAKSGLAGFKSSLSGFARSTSGMLTGLVSFAGVTAAINETKDALAAFGAIADAASSSGLDAEFLQGIAYQAKLAGVEFGTLSGALDSFNKNSGLAAVNKGRMASALKALNPELLENIKNATTQEQRVRLAADAIRDAATASERAALATTLFGDAGAKLAGVFAGGASEIDSMMAKARDMGLIVERDLIARADELGDQFDTTSQIVGLKLQKALIDLGPVLIGLIDLGGKFAETMAFVAQGLKTTEDQTREHLERRLELLQSGGQGITGKGGTAALEAAEAKRLNDIAEVMGELRERALDDLRRTLTEQATIIPDFDLTDLDGLQTELAEVGTGANAASQALASMGDSVVAGIEPVNDALVQMSETLASGLADVFSSVVDGSKTATEAVGDLLKSLGDMLIHQGFQSLIGGIFGNGGGGGGIGSFISSLFGGVGGGPVRLGFNLPGFAEGTDFAPGGMALVGERGPELVNLPRGSQVIPNDELGGGGLSVSISVDARGAQQGVGAEIARALSDFSKNELPSRLQQINRNPLRR